VSTLAGLPFPSGDQPVVDDKKRLGQTWHGFFAGLVAKAPPIAPVTVGVSPFAYTASTFGFLHVTGGVVSAISLTRAAVVLATGLTSGFIPMAQGDIVKITYTGKPTVNFVPQ
jgi:hypothetical protein